MTNTFWLWFIISYVHFNIVGGNVEILKVSVQETENDGKYSIFSSVIYTVVSDTDQELSRATALFECQRHLRLRQYLDTHGINICTQN